ncbi:BolA family protein [Marinicellulosiphila megalodicopiae]|uniref:BolA family protein n=1 Tax=Marinicellulosiphila megalodicopiae TaxID=2724896 RepID=UPI003BAF6F6C
MSPQQVKELLLSQFEDQHVSVEGEGAKFHVTIKSDKFKGLMPVKRQQLVYGCLNDVIASGEVHAVTMSLSTES